MNVSIRLLTGLLNDEYNVVFEAVTRENKIDIESDKRPLY